MPGYLSGTKNDLGKFNIKMKSSKPVIPEYWWQNLPADDKAIRNRLVKQYEGKDVSELKGIYQNLSGYSNKSPSVGVDTLIKHIVYIRMKAKDY